MPKQLQTIGIPGPGSWGLNTEGEFQQQDPRWAIQADNCVIDDKGVISSRKGWTQTTTSALSGTPVIERIWEYIDNSNTTAIISAANNKIYEGTTTLTDITGTATTPTANKWKFQNLNGKVVGWQSGHTPIVKNGAGTGNTFSDITASSGSLPTGNEVLAAYGRLWAVDSDGTTIKYSDLLDETGWSVGSAGNLDTYSVWTSGADEVVALAAFKDRLIIFGKKEILIYTGTADPNTSLALEDVIKGIGCVARDSVQNTGNDIIFLSNSGVSSLSRAIQGGDVPLQQLSGRVYSNLVRFTTTEPVEDIQSEYVETEGIYLISFPSSDVVYCFDLVQSIPETNLPRITTWSQITPTALKETRSGTLYIGKAGVIGTYKGSQDNGSSYFLRLRTARSQGTENPLTKIFKIARSWVFGANGQLVIVFWEMDFGDFQDSGQDTLEAGNVAEYGEAEYNIAEYSGGLTTDLINVPMSGTGKTFSIEYRVPVDGQEVSINRLDLYIKAGTIK